MKLRSVLLAATVLALPMAAHAQFMAPVPGAVTGIYIGAGLGANFLSEVDGKNISVPVPKGIASVPVTNGKFGSSGGVVGLASIGYGFGNGLRLELEGNYRNNNTHLTNTSLNGGATIQQYGGMVNALYDFVGLSPWVVPYIGVGGGYGAVNLQNFKVYGFTGPSGTTRLQMNGDNGAKGAGAVQGILGAAWPIAAVPGLAITTEGRYMQTFSSARYNGTVTAYNASGTPIGTAGGGGVKIGNLSNWSLLLGVRYNFGVAPPPPPPPAPAPVAAPARSYLVFFDWDKYDLTPRARQIVAEAAQNSTKVQVTRIDVQGNADTSGTPSYNMGLSRRRAETVAAELVRLGVPRNIIQIQYFGDTRPLVPTGPGVREPQNRRVEIILR